MTRADGWLTARDQKAGRLWARPFATPVVKIILLGLALQFSNILPAKAAEVLASLSPVPYDFVAPGEIARRLSTGPLTKILG